MSRSRVKKRGEQQELPQSEETDGEMDGEVSVEISEIEVPGAGVLRIDSEFENLVPPLSEGERELLRESLERRGWDNGQSLLVWEETGVLLDGHNRVRLIARLASQGTEIRPSVTSLSFASRDAAFDFVLLSQLTRRNLSGNGIAYLRGVRYNAEKRRRGNPGKKESKATAGELGKVFSVSARTVERDGKFAAEVLEIASGRLLVRNRFLRSGALFTRRDVSALLRLDPAQREAVLDIVDDKEAKKALTRLRLGEREPIPGYALVAAFETESRRDEVLAALLGSGARAKTLKTVPRSLGESEEEGA